MKTGYAVGDAMTKEPITASSDSSLAQCCTIMDQNDVGGILVMEGKTVKGILTSSDIISSVAQGLDLENRSASEFTYKSFPRIDPEMDIHDVLIKMGELDMRQMPVFNRDELVGLLTLKDILKIEPMLFELIVSKMDIREEHRKPIYKKGKCEVCGKDAEDLLRIRGQLVGGCCRIF